MFGKNKTITLVALAGGFFSIALSLLLNSAAFAAVSAFFFFLALLLWKYSYLIIPMITHATNVVEIREGYEIPPSRDILLKRTDSGYLASVFLGISLTESVSTKSGHSKTMMMELFERAISSLRPLTKISLVLSNLDLESYLDKLKEKRSSAETRLSRLRKSSKSDDGEIAKTEREIAFYSRQLETLSKGQKPMQVVAYAMTTASGISREEATSRARAQGKQALAVLSNSLGASVWMLKGEEMLRAFEWERHLPPARAELEDTMF